MTDPIEQQLREVFAHDAALAPPPLALGERAMRQVRRRRTRLAVTSVTATACVAAVAVLASLLTAQHSGNPITVPSGTISHDAQPHNGTASGALPDNGTASCAGEYSATALRQRAFAFDGTVTTIGPARTNRSGADLSLVAATFRVNQWFRGGSSATVTVDITPPDPGGVEDSAPAYRIGSRLLVSGEPRWGGSPLTDAIAWACGFTRYYDPATAETWRTALD
jgi:hypothetical protein